MSKQTEMQESAQAGIEDFNGIFQERLRGIVRDGLLAMFEQAVTSCVGKRIARLRVFIAGRAVRW